MKTFAIVGCGHLGKIIKESYVKGLLEGYELVAAFSRKIEDAQILVEDTEGVAVATIEEVIAKRPDYIIETASIALFKSFALKALEKGISVIPLSIGAFADDEFKAQAIQEAKKSGAKIHIPSGAVGGFDVLQTISLIAQAENKEITAGIHTHKGPNSLKNTPLYEDMLLSEEKTVFKGTTKGAIALLPTKVNVAVASALASIGPENASAEITSVPLFVGDDHTITVETEGLKATVDIYSATSDIAAWSVVALLRNLSSPMVFF